jgi:hypothetical protein
VKYSRDICRLTTSINSNMRLGLLYEYYAGHRPLSKVYLIYTTFRDLALLPSQGDDCYYIDRFVITFLFLKLAATTEIKSLAF